MIRNLSKVVSLLSTFVGCSLVLAQSPELVSTLVIPGESTDLYVGPASANTNRLGGPFSDLYYNRQDGSFYGLVDRGPGGGLISYETRVEKFKVNINNKTGDLSEFRVQSTILFKNSDGFTSFNGLNPRLLNGNSSILGNSFDPEGIAVGPNGNIFISDEYGPAVYEFEIIEVSEQNSIARFVRSFTLPSNIVPFAGATLNFVDGRGVLTSGRQDNRGFEGLAITPDGTTLVACLQDPLIDEGNLFEGRRGLNVRLVAFDIATGTASKQYAYQLETIASINARIPGTANDFGATSQGRNIGLSGIVALNNEEFLVIERDNRGLGVDDPTHALPVGSKRVFKVNVSGASDVTSIVMAGSNGLPVSVTAVTKTLWLDIAQSLSDADLIIPEKIEGLAIGPKLKDGSFAILIGTDNDFSVTQTGAGTQLDVYTDGTNGPIDGPAFGRSLIPIFMYSFKSSVAGFTPGFWE